MTAEGRQGGARNRAGQAGRVALLLVAGFVAYWPALDNRFALDDHEIARTTDNPKNRMVGELRPIGEYFTTEYWTGAGHVISSSNPLYRPVTVYSLALTHALFPGGRETGAPGLRLAQEAYPHHLLNLVLHALAVLLVHRLIVQAGAPGWPALLASLCFALHAIHTEAVASIVGRADLLAFCCGAGAALAHAAGLARPRRRAAYLPLSALLLFLAFCSKESAVAWVGFLPLYGMFACGADAPAPGDHHPGVLRVLAAPLGWSLAVAIPAIAGWAVLRAGALQGLPEGYGVAYLANPIAGSPVLERLLTAVKVWAYGLYLTLLPFSLASDYGPETFDTAARVLDAGFLTAAAVLLGGLLTGVRVLPRRSLLALGALSWFGFSFLTTNVPFPVGVLFAERLYYTASIGLSFLVAWLLVRSAGRRRLRSVSLALVSLWCLASGVKTWTRSGDWRDNASLLLTDVQTHPRSLGLRLQAASTCRELGRDAEFHQHIAAALELEPQLGRAYGELGSFFLEHRNFARAEEMLRKGLAAKLLTRAEQPLLHFNLGYLLIVTGRAPEAAKHLAAAVRVAPEDSAMRHRVLTVASGVLTSETWVELLEGGEERDPGRPYWQLHRAGLAFRQQRFEVAARLFGRALERLPLGDLGVDRAWLDYAASLARVGQQPRAATILRNLLRTPRFREPRLRRTAERQLRQYEPK